MNTRISKKFPLQAAIHYEGNFIINNYDLELFMDVTTESIREQNIAMDRIKYLFEYCFDSCIFIDVNDTKAMEAYSKTGIRICPLPDEPYDQVVAAVLISKINAITDGHLFLTEIKIRSDICDDVYFYVSQEEEAEFQQLSGVWWTDSSPNTNIFLKKTKREKVVDLRKEQIDWNSLGLGWKEECKKDKGEVLYIPVDK